MQKSAVAGGSVRDDNDTQHPNSAPQSQASPVTRTSTQVSYIGGLLTIDARNATLAEVLKQVSQKTGAEIEIPPGGGTERIAEHAGPGSPSDVLTHLLIGSSFNFVIVNSAEHPQDLERVLLWLHGTGTAPSVVGPVQESATADASPLWKPPDEANAPDVVPARLDVSLTLPDDAATMTPEARGEFMKKKFDELREKAQQQTPQ